MSMQNNLFQIVSLAFFLILSHILIQCVALLLKCPLYQLHLQKIVGFRPPLDYLSERNLIYAPVNNFKDRKRVTRNGYIWPTEHQIEAVPSMLCWRKCNEDPDCMAYVHLLDTNECYGYTYFEHTTHYLAIDAELLPLVADTDAIFYEKTCLTVPETCKGRRWALTKIPGTSLVFQSKKTIPILVTRRECAEKCFYETEFKCLSASFAPSYRNNRARFFEYTPKRSQYSLLGRCMLSDKDKMIQPDAFRAAPYDEEYIENQCYERAIENDNCAYELYANSSFIYAEVKYLGLTQKECQALCTHETSFYCQGISFYYESENTHSECALHSEDIVSMGPRSLKLRENSIYMRRVKCLDVQVLCTHDLMSIKYKPKDWFAGKIYVSMHSKDCSVHGNGTQNVVLHLEIGSESKENRCGVLRAYEMTKSYQRTFISALVVIQNNPNVQTQGDRLIKVGCIMSNISQRVSSGSAFMDNAEPVPNAIALESTLAYAESLLPHEAVWNFNNTPINPQIVPKITLQIVDLAHQHETNDVQIGQNLELQIIAEYTAQQLAQRLGLDLPPLPDFRATTLVARTPDNLNYILLIDERGCPTDVSVFPALIRVRTHNGSMLHGNFHAFKFSGTSNVNFDVKIHYCADECPPMNCMQYGSSAAENWQRNRRGINKHHIELQGEPESLEQNERRKVQNPIYISTVVDVIDEETNKTKELNGTTQKMLDFGVMPLNYSLRVHGPDQANSNSFLYGERGVLLIAGIDDQIHLDNICLNQSLLIAIFIFWLIFQVALIFICYYVLQKYKRLAKLDEERRRLYEEYLEARRVHWADQGGYTL